MHQFVFTKPRVTAVCKDSSLSLLVKCVEHMDRDSGWRAKLLILAIYAGAELMFRRLNLKSGHEHNSTLLACLLLECLALFSTTHSPTVSA